MKKEFEIYHSLLLFFVSYIIVYYCKCVVLRQNINMIKQKCFVKTQPQTHKYCFLAQSFRHCQLSRDEANTLSKPVRKKMSLSVYLAVSITITHSFPSRLHEYASSPEALYTRGRPTCFLPGAASLFWEVQCMTNCI